MIRKLVLVTAGLVLFVAAPAAAGGWAVSTLDQPPSTLVAGQDTQVGFVIRQHGKTPVNPDSGTIGIRLTEQATGRVYEFPAAQTGPTGHFVATVRPPTAGAWTWEVLQGWFAPQELGPITVVGLAASPLSAQAAPTVVATAPGVEWWRVAAITVAGGLGLVFLADLVLGRRSARRRDGLASRAPVA